MRSNQLLRTAEFEAIVQRVAVVCGPHDTFVVDGIAVLLAEVPPVTPLEVRRDPVKHHAAHDDKHEDPADD